MNAQQGDVLLCQTNDGGEINVENGIVEMSGGLETSVYLALFGGDEDGKNWWGNIDEIDPAKRYVSETQQLLRSLPATSANLRRVEDAANRDLSYLLELNIASSVSVFAAIVGVGKVDISVNIFAQGEESSFNFTENWRATT